MTQMTEANGSQPLFPTQRVQLLNSRSQFSFSQPTNLSFPWITQLDQVTPVTTLHIIYINHGILCKMGLGAEVPNRQRDIFPTCIINATQTVAVLRYREQISVQ
jgi:hypothetical protein